ncbi:MAG TPA: hypothetical protein VHK91_00040, partial [Flavisolibacter sp.]|nr:hypothetical protein [Flavisolibacter sp.]
EALKISSSKADVYGGLSIYHRSYTLKYDGIDGKEKVTDGVLGVGIFAGGRYYFAPNVGAFAELGYGISPLQLGLTVKF